MHREQAQTLITHLETVVEHTHRLHLELLETWKLALEVDEPATPVQPVELATPVPDDILPDKPVLNVEEVAQILGLGRASAYRAVQLGQIPSFRVGRRLLVPRSALLALLRGSFAK
jgi:excisionase family DNA binding protein